MSYEADVWNALHSTLVAGQAAGQPLAFVASGSIFPGARPIPANACPVIIMEPLQTVDAFFMEPHGIKALYRVLVACVVNHSVVAKSIIGDTGSPVVVGILDMVQAVKTVLQADQKLGGASSNRVTKVRFPLTRYVPPAETYPMREAQITVEVEVQLTTTTR